MIHLRSVEILPALMPDATDYGYPFGVPAVAALSETPLEFNTPVTFFVGENGTGKSAILEGIACAAGLPAIAGEDPRRDPTLAHARRLGDRLRLAWRARTRQGFFLRAEDFFGYAKFISALWSGLEQDLAEFDARPGTDSHGHRLARGAYLREIGELQRTDRMVNDVSHGESFLELFQRRFLPRGLYLLDEPEAPLSPMRQLAMLAILRQMTGPGESQFIIATHSPLLMAFLGATIYALDGGVPRHVGWNDLEHVSLTRDFLNNPASFLRPLFEE